MRMTRADRSIVSDWWFTVDRLTLASAVLLLAAGLVLTLAASPPVAARLGLDPFHFVYRQMAIAPLALGVMIAASILSPRLIRRASLALMLGGLCLMVLALQFGMEIKGAHRWLMIGSFALQPSELVKPGFIVLSAWFLAESQRRADMPGVWIAVALFGLFAGLLVLQPDFGQTVLITLVWGGLFFMAGIGMWQVAGLAALGALGMAAAYFTAPHFASRIDRFLDPESGDTYQSDRALESFLNGGWFGTGPGEGTVKHLLPDSHTDFVFAVAAEEYGLIACLLLVGLYGFIVLRGLGLAAREPDGFLRYAVAGLVMLFGLQAVINMAVNVGLAPAKGMTLPFISYGGSSMIGMALVLGFLLGLTRRRPRTDGYVQGDDISMIPRLNPKPA
jgi:cell division protein FtsW